MSFSSIVRVPLTAILLATPASAGVLVVDHASGPGANFTSVADAVNAASDGDILLIRSGTYSAFSINGKALTLTADAGANVTCIDPPRGSGLLGNEVKNVPAGKSVAIRGLRIVELVLRSNAGPVRFDDCTISASTIAADLDNCAAVSFTHCAIDGIDGYNSIYGSGPAGIGLHSVGSEVLLDHCTVTGGDGADAFVDTAMNLSFSASLAAPAAALNGGAAIATATSFVGGAGGTGISFSLWCFAPTPGEAGIVVANSATLFSHASTFAGGAGASGCQGFTNVNSPPGSATVTSTGGTIVPLSGGARDFDVTSPARELQNVQVSIAGVGGDVPLVLVSAAQSFTLIPGLRGALLVGAPPLVIGLAALPPGGAASFPVAIPTLPPGVLGVVTFAESAFCPPGAPCVLGPSKTVVLLDQSL